MRTTEVDFEGRLPMTATAPGGFRVAGAVHRGPLGLVPEGVVAWDGLPGLGRSWNGWRTSTFCWSAWARAMGPLPEGFAAERGGARGGGRRRGGMATPSACRTYNVLLAEGRRVAAALMPV